MKSELEAVRDKLNVGVDELEGRNEGVDGRVRELESEVDDILDRLHEIDKSWQNNLVRVYLQYDNNDKQE